MRVKVNATLLDLMVDPSRNPQGRKADGSRKGNLCEGQGMSID